MANKYSLRDYQREVLESISAGLERGVQRQLVALPTGTGKTVLIAHIQEIHPGRTLVLAHREKLLEQTQEKILSINPRLFVGIEQGSNHASSHCDVVLATPQTLGRSDPRRREKFYRGFKNIIPDEAHHSVAKTYTTVFEHYGFNCSKERFANKELFTDPEDSLLVGFSATPSRSDNVGLEKVFDEVINGKSYPLTLHDFIREGWLVDIQCKRVFSKTSLDEIKLQHGDFQEGQLSKTVNTEYRNSLVVNGYRDHASGKKAICFAVDVQHCRDLTDLFCRNGIRAEMIVADTDRSSRIGILRRFSEGITAVLVGCMVFTEGFDSPDTEVIIMARPTKSQNVYIQQMGRGTRPVCHLPIDSNAIERLELIEESRKPYMLLIDVVDNSKKNDPIMLPTIFGLDKDIKTTLAISATLAKIKTEAPNVDVAKVKNIEQLQKLKTEAEHVDIFANVKTPAEIVKNSKLQWLKTNNGGYRISPEPDEHFILRENTLGKWEAVYEFVEDGRSHQVVKGESQTLPDIFNRADVWIARHYPESMKFLDRTAKSKSNPPSEKQLRFLRNHGFKYVMDGIKMLARTEDGFVPVTNGMASEFIGKKIAEWENRKPKPVPLPESKPPF